MAQSYTYTQNGQQYTATPMAGTTAPPVAPAGSGVTYTPANQQTLYKTAGGQYSTDPSVLTGNYSVVNQAVPTSAIGQQPINIQPPPTPTNYTGAIIGANVAGGANPATGMYDPVTGAPTAGAGSKTGTDPQVKVLQDYITELTGAMKTPESAAASNLKAEQASGILLAQQQKNNTQSQINGITAEAQVAQLALTGQGRGIPEWMIGGQQAQISKEATIKLLPLQAQLATDQGDLQMATARYDTLFKIYREDATAPVEQYNKLVLAAYGYMTSAEQKKADLLVDEKKSMNAQLQTTIAWQRKLTADASAAGNSSGATQIAQIQPPTALAGTQDYTKQLAEYNSKLTSVAGLYGTDTLDREYKKAQTEKLKAEVAEKAGGASQYGLEPDDPIFFAVQGIKTEIGKKSAIQKYANLINSGNVEGSKKFLDTVAYQSLTPPQKEDYGVYSDGQRIIGNVLGDMTKFKESNIGVWNTALQKALPLVNLQKNQKWVDITSQIEVAQARVRRGFFGTALTGTEKGSADMFLVDFGKDDIATAQTKLENLGQLAADIKARLLRESKGEFEVPQDSGVTPPAKEGDTHQEGNLFYKVINGIWTLQNTK